MGEKVLPNDLTRMPSPTFLLKNDLVHMVYKK